MDRSNMKNSYPAPLYSWYELLFPFIFFYIYQKYFMGFDFEKYFYCTITLPGS